MKKANIPLKATAFACTIAIGLLVLSACSKKEEASTKAPTQVAAKVGSEEISVHQINQVLSRANTNGASPEVIQVMGREALEKLIDQQVAIDQATESKLHRSAEVIAQIESARRDILARAYIQQFTATLPKPTADEAKKYFAEHPQLFSERRVFNVQELQVTPAAAVIEDLKSFAAAGKPIEEVAAWLKSKGINFNAGAATRTAEQMPLDLLPKIHALKDGQSTVFESPQGITFLRVAASKAAPVPEAAAIPRIEQFLANQRATEAVTANIKQLRANAKITYMGEFAKPLPALGAAAAGTPTATPKATAEPVSTPNAPEAQDKSAIEKGVAGLK